MHPVVNLHSLLSSRLLYELVASCVKIEDFLLIFQNRYIYLFCHSLWIDLLHQCNASLCHKYNCMEINILNLFWHTFWLFFLKRKVIVLLVFALLLSIKSLTSHISIAITFKREFCFGRYKPRDLIEDRPLTSSWRHFQYLPLHIILHMFSDKLVVSVLQAYIVVSY